ncbi:MAG: chromosomal replication initiator protein DnaA [Deltaproteobacteria bacterium]|nr:chromosomal replication initiator protein DnaA [Deltaproteobacteria bacterium]
MLEIWTKATDALRSTTERAAFDAWIAPIRFLEGTRESLRLAVPDQRFKDHVVSHHGEQILAAIDRVGAVGAAIEFVVERPADGPRDQFELFGASAPETPAIAADRAAIGPSLLPSLTFDRFVVGDANRLAHGTAQAVAHADRATFNPLFIHGGVGNGKTHLLHAIGLEMTRLRPGARVRYVPAAVFIDDVVAALRSQRSTTRMAAIRDRYRAVDVLLVDDVQFLQNKTQTQVEFFHTFNALQQAGKHIVLTSDRAPSLLESFDDRLRSRFDWGVIAEITPPDESLRLALLHRKAQERGLRLPHEVADYLCQRLRSSARELEGAVIKLEAHQRFIGGEIDLEMARSILGPLADAPSYRFDAEAVQRATARHYGVKIQDLKGNRRQRIVTTARMVAMYLVRKHNETSYPELGRLFGGRDHTTAINACRRVAEWIASDATVAQAVAEIEGALQR